MLSLLRAALLVLVAVLAGCAATPSGEGDEPVTGTVSQAITNGEADDSDNAVVALMAGGEAFCSGTLISPYVVLTAAHCVTPSKPDQVFFGQTATDDGTMVAVAETHYHPDFDGDTLSNDIGIVALSKPAPFKPKARISADDLSDDDWQGLAIRIVGFGATKIGKSTGTKREGATTIDSVGNTTFKFLPSPSQTCSGDSGGAAFATVNGKEVLVGVTSAGDEACAQYGRDMRVDAFSDFIDGKMKAYSATVEQQQAAAAAQSCSFSSTPVRGGAGAVSVLPLLALLVLRRRAQK